MHAVSMWMARGLHAVVRTAEELSARGQEQPPREQEQPASPGP